jgi:hypothetical protein
MSLEQKRTYNFILKKIYIKGYELYPQSYTELNIYESLVFPAITGDIAVQDWQGFNEVGEIYAMDQIQIIFSTADRADLSLTFTIYASETIMASTGTHHPVLYKFCSPWLIDAIATEYSKSWKEKYVHEIVTDILEYCGATMGIVEPTKQKLHRFTTPLWSPLHSIHHLSTFAINQDNKGGYVFWTDLKTGKVNYTTIDYLFTGKYGKEDQVFKALPKNQFYEARIYEMKLENNFDVIRAINQGMQRQQTTAYNYDTNKTYDFKTPANKIPYTHLSKFMCINSYFDNEKYTSVSGEYLYPVKDTLVTDEKEFTDLIDGRIKTRYTRLFSDEMKLTAKTNTNSERRVGNLCQVEYQSEDKTRAEWNKMYTGFYLIRNLRHLIYSGNYKHIVTFMSDGLKESKNNLIQWS